MTIVHLFFYVSLFIIFWANVGYPLSILIIGKFTKKKNDKKSDFFPSVTVMVVAHNEEKVILQKMKNLREISYPKDKIKFLVSSDNSTDRTNDIVDQFIANNKDMDITLYKVNKRLGKTNAQNEAQKIVDTEFLVMTDANSMLKQDSVKELMSSFSHDDIYYVTGRLIYTNSLENITANLETTYWDLDLEIRDIESRIQTITAGNGAIYACRNNKYIDFPPINNHDLSMPITFSLNQKRAIANHDAIAYEKAGENTSDEFQRKVRMNRLLVSHILPSIGILNIFKYKWFTYFYLGHRTSRYLLWLAHLLLLISNIIWSFSSPIMAVILILHVLVIILGIVQFKIKSNNKKLRMIEYYLMTIVAQIRGVYNVATGNAKPFWEKAESTR